ncbi:MAG: ABC transporter substrate-binding protein [Bacteroidales bacterium]|jgi:iron complex transport system substrate-binding protein|nr:ABC transporter substrate-binding protein [Bacteroidales bacterium]
MRIKITSYWYGIIVFFTIIASCSNQQQTSTHHADNIFTHAKNIYSAKGSNRVTIYFSWNSHRDSLVYILTDSSSSNNNKKQNKGIHITTPLSQVAALSTTHIGMIHELEKTESIRGICDYFRISNPAILQKYYNNEITDLGSSMNLNKESIITLKPDAIFKVAFNAEDIKENALFQKINIPIIYTYSWHEKTPLARAEWIKFFGMLYNCRDKADSIFNQVEKRYLELQALADTITHKPQILAGDMIKDTWYMPGGESYFGNYICDAGGNYIFSHDSSTGSVPINIEKVLEISKDAHIWVGVQTESYADLQSKSKTYSHLHAFQKHNCYNYFARTNGDGGNDYWETGFVRPDIVLADLIHIFHPDILPNHSLVFYKKLE